MSARTLILPALLPAILLAVSIVVSVFGERSLLIGRIDAIVLAAIVGYLSLVALLATSRGALARLCLLTYSCLFAVGLLEFAMRWVGDSGAIRPAPWPKLQLLSEASDSMPGIEGEIRFTTNSLGLRGPDISLPELEATQLKILCVGGSTTECLYVRDEASWPWRMGDILDEAMDESVYVGNAGRSGQFTLNHLYLLQKYPLAEKFDWIVMLCGMNDAGALFRENYHERARAVSEETLVGDEAARPGPFYRRLALVRRCQEIVARSMQTTPSITQDPTGAWYDTIRQQRRDALALRTITELPDELAASQTRYRATLQSIIQLCRDRGQRIVFLTQPTLYQTDMPAELQGLLWQHREVEAFAPKILEQILDAFNATLVAVCEEEHVPYVDLAGRLPKDTTVFYDDCHFNISGSLQVAELVAGFFLNERRDPKAE